MGALRDHVKISQSTSRAYISPISPLEHQRKCDIATAPWPTECLTGYLEKLLPGDESRVLYQSKKVRPGDS